MSGKRYQSGYDDGFKAGQWAAGGDPWPLVRELQDALEKRMSFSCECGACKRDKTLVARATAALKRREGVGR